jgi:hypothetical protein
MTWLNGPEGKVEKEKFRSQVPLYQQSAVAISGRKEFRGSGLQLRDILE